MSDNDHIAETLPVECLGDPVTVVPQASVGQQLRAARLEARLSVTDVAQALKFSPRQIELLEQDDHAALPGMTIVRGFVRGYSRLLKLDTDALLKMLEAASPLMMADVRPPENMGLAGVEGDQQKIGPVLSLAMVVMLAALMLAGWHFFGPKPVTSSHSVAVPAPSSVTSAPAALPPPPQSDPTPAPASSSSPEPVPALKFTFEARSWLEVLDADAKLLHSAENPAGAQLSLSGKPPFDIVVGNAARVKLTYGDRVIDLQPYTRADVARLKVE